MKAIFWVACMEMGHHGKNKDRGKFRDRNQINSVLLIRPPFVCPQFPIVVCKMFSAVSETTTNK